MKKLVDVDGGLVTLIGKRVTFLCANYFYTGVLVGVNETFALLEDPSIVYETGPWADKQWRDAQALPGPVYVMLHSIEAYGEWK